MVYRKDARTAWQQIGTCTGCCQCLLLHDNEPLLVRGYPSVEAFLGDLGSPAA